MANSEREYTDSNETDLILECPDMYIGSIVEQKGKVWSYSVEKEKIEKKKARYVPGLLKIFDEILVNAADNKMDNLGTNRIEININKEEKFISIFNNGQGIPIKKYKNTEEYIVSEVFQKMRFSSNRGSKPRFTGGKNCYGAKLCNIFSEKFMVETACNGRKFTRTWKGNMKSVEDPEIDESYQGHDFTRVTFWPDLKIFHYLGPSTIGMMRLRACEIAACTGIEVFIDNKILPFGNLKDYMRLYSKNEDNIVYDKWDKWEVGLMPSNKGFQQISFVNNLATTSGGKHVEHVKSTVVKALFDKLYSTKNKQLTTNKNSRKREIGNRCWIFINCLVNNPKFDCQKKEKMTTLVKDFESRCNLPKTFLEQLTKPRIMKYLPSGQRYRDSSGDESDTSSNSEESALEADSFVEDIPSSSSGVEDIMVPKETVCHNYNELPEFELPVDTINAIVSVGGILLKSKNFDLLPSQTTASECPNLFFMSENGFALNAMPSRYIPIIPTVLVNKLENQIFPKYNLQDIIDNFKRKLDGTDMLPMTPWHKDFEGTIKDNKNGSYTVAGKYSITGTDTIEITALPIGTDAKNYKSEVLEELKTKMDVIDYIECNNTGDKFVITFPPERLDSLNNLEALKLEKTIHLELIAFDKYSKIKSYKSMDDLLEDFYEFSLGVYEKWKNYSENLLKTQIQYMENSSDSKCHIETVEKQLKVLQAKSPKDLWEENLTRLSDAIARIKDDEKSTRKRMHNEDNPSSSGQDMKRKRPTVY